jgi:hypothetical protein
MLRRTLRVLGVLGALLMVMGLPAGVQARVACRAVHGPRFCEAHEQRVAIRRLLPALRAQEARTHRKAMAVPIDWHIDRLKHLNDGLRGRIEWLQSLPSWHPEDPSGAIHAAATSYGVSEPGMRRTAWCESNMGQQRWPEPGSGASGLFQFIPGTWADTWAGRQGISVWDNYWNAQMAARAVSHTAGRGAYPSDWHSSGWVCPV